MPPLPKIRRIRFRLSALVVLAAYMLLALPAAGQPIHDAFEGARIDETKWTLQQIDPNQLKLAAPGRCGTQSAQVTVTTGDGGASCDACQRAEIRTHHGLWPVWGTETWYGFSFRASGDVPATGSRRTVIGQWKSPVDHSPFLAQRFDNGVFHITVQDNDRRRVIASAQGDYDRLKEFQSVLARLGAEGRKGLEAIEAFRAEAEYRQSLRALASTGRSPNLERFLSNKLRGLLGGPGGAPSDTGSLFSEFGFLSDLDRYIETPRIQIVGGAPKALPDPKKGWIDMVYRIRGGHEDNLYGPATPGEIDVWANGEKIVSVRGNIGYTIGEDLDRMSQYFKFGIYRDRSLNDMTVYFDEFRRGQSRAEVEVGCGDGNSE